MNLGPWSGAPPTSWPEAQTPPAWFRLDTVPILQGAGHYAVEPAALVSNHRLKADWRFLDRDSGRVVDDS